jgi:hypothetical protein
VRDHSGDVPPKAILDELLRVGVVEMTEKNRIRLLSRAYIPRGDEPQMLSILGTDVSHLITTIDYNIADKGTDPFFQRKVSYDNVPVEALPELRQLGAEQGQLLLEKLNKSFSKQDRDVNPSVKGSGRYQVGVGIYYFEESLDEEIVHSNLFGSCIPHPGSLLWRWRRRKQQRWWRNWRLRCDGRFFRGC